MLVFSLAVVLIGRADQSFSDRLRTDLDDLLAPAYAVISAPIEAAVHGTGAVANLLQLQAQNDQLRTENARLLQWQAVAMALEAQNNALKASLNYVPVPTPKFYSADVVADLGGVYTRSVLVTLPPGEADPTQIIGAIAMDGRGVVGRVVEAGGRSARVLLINDMNSRIPVALGASGAPALMAGTNREDPSLIYWAPDHPPAEGDMVLTSAAGGAFPPGLPVGVVHYDAQNDPVVLPLADLGALRLLRLFSYPDSLPVLTPVAHVEHKSAPAHGASKTAPAAATPLAAKHRKKS
ncbi:MAG TPA: rod shape-determining protein MreC [Acidocella sp.]|nr:rod shape-determining protein MreC [Acidocella sp.]